MMVILVAETTGVTTKRDTPTQAEIDSSGIGNSHMYIDSQNKDQYPLMEPFTACFTLNYLLEITPPKISL